MQRLSVVSGLLLGAVLLAAPAASAQAESTANGAPAGNCRPASVDSPQRVCQNRFMCDRNVWYQYCREDAGGPWYWQPIGSCVG
ncbi:hypothetical protein GCM10009544_38160 [Streptomyces stramineus]|uniref:Chitin-binding type-2 domain-containing protein n=2 Tax=Streptomyces TaxID=1883 RepID=A0ABP3K697_9ACTN